MPSAHGSRAEVEPPRMGLLHASSLTQGAGAEHQTGLTALGQKSLSLQSGVLEPTCFGSTDSLRADAALSLATVEVHLQPTP